MEMFLTVLAISLLAVLVSAVLFVAAARQPPSDALRPDERLLNLPSHFFADDRTSHGSTVVPVEVLLLQIERHVRLEQAAAEAFQGSPTAEALRRPTTSPLQHAPVAGKGVWP